VAASRHARVGRIPLRGVFRGAGDAVAGGCGRVVSAAREPRRPDGAQQIAERSPIKEWLAGSRTGSSPCCPKTGIVIGEMPIMGPTGNMTSRPSTTTGSNELRLMEKEREEARQD
jgi:hypothetical protein